MLPQFAINDGTGYFTFSRSNPTRTTRNRQFPALAAGDVDGDGDLDLAAFNYETTATLTPQMYFNDGIATLVLDQELDLGSAGSMGYLADLNGDGFLDFLATSRIISQSVVLINDGYGGFAPDSTISISGSCHSLAIGDVRHKQR